VQGDVVQISDVSPDALKAAATQIKDHIVLIDTAKLYVDRYRKAAKLLNAAYPVFKDEGAVAVLSPDREMNNILNAHSAGWHAALSPLPLVQIGMEDAKLIARAVQAGNVRVKLDVQNKTSGTTPVNNVIAELRGSEHPEEWILLGAHLDSWDYGTGAQDNGSGSAMVLEAARVLAALGQPRRSIRFALWGGEEEGVLGSYAYTQQHTAELEKCIAVLNTDNGAGHPKGWKVEGRKDLADAMAPISQSLKGLDGDDLSQEVTYDTDHGPFMLYGIPALDLEVDMTHYMEIHHKSSDTFDKVDPLFFRADAAILTITAYDIVQNPQPLAPHIDHAAVGDILKKARLDELLQDVGVWKP
jgi:Iap family predicted aminopeptidase